MENYKEIIDRSIKELEACEFPIKIYVRQMTSFLEEENKRLEGSKREEFYDCGVSTERGYNQAKQEEIDHNLQVITYLKEL